MTSNKEKYNGKVTKEIENILATTRKKQIYSRRHNNNHQISNATDFIGNTPDIGEI